MNRHLTLPHHPAVLIALSCLHAAPSGTAVYQPQAVNCYIPPGSAPEAVATLTTRCQQDAQATIAVQAQATRQVQEGNGRGYPTVHGSGAGDCGELRPWPQLQPVRI
jgi:hypothetical protein